VRTLSIRLIVENLATRGDASPTLPVSVAHHKLTPPAPYLLQQQFVASALNRVWVGDIMLVSTRAGWFYVAVLPDLCSRQVIGWAIRDKPDQHLTLETLAIAVRQRRVQSGLIHHADCGAQYTYGPYQQQLRAQGITPSMSGKGNGYDHAVAESVFSTLKNELIHHQTYHSRDEASREIFVFIEGFRHRQRRH